MAKTCEWADTMPEVYEWRALGLTDSEIADILYDNFVISYIERDQLKGGLNNDQNF